MVELIAFAFLAVCGVYLVIIPIMALISPPCQYAAIWMNQSSRIVRLIIPLKSD